MLTFEMNAANFETYLGGGTADGTRAVEAGVELDLAEHPADGQTLGLWHLHDEVWTDTSGNGRTLTPQNGAALGPLGAEFVRSSEQYASCTLGLQGKSALTIECWIRLDSLPEPGEVYYIVTQYWNAYLYLHHTGGTLKLCGYVREDAASGYIKGSAVTVAIEVGQWHHLALTWQQGVACRTWLDGVNVGSDTSLTGQGLKYPSTQFQVGYPSASGDYGLDGAVDELRVSDVLRYAASFEPERYVASGTFTSPAFDTERTACQWLPLQWSAPAPGGSSVAMSVRSGDELDGGGQVLAEWQPAGGDPADGRYQQWRATLTRSTDPLGLQTPTLEAVTATSSEAGYSLYQGMGETAAAIDYAGAVALLGPAVTSYAVEGLAYPAVHWFGLRSTNAWGVESRTVDAEVRLELDDGADIVPPRPAPVESLEARGAAGGKARLQWLALGEMGQAPPDVFRIYSDGGAGGGINFADPVGQVDYIAALRTYEWTSEPLADGLTVTFAVRAETAAGGVDADPAEVQIEIDALPPAAVGSPEGSAVLAD